MRQAAFVSLYVIALLTAAITVSAQTEGFINVGGTNLETRMNDAMRQGESSDKRYWTAYSFDVRPGVAVDMQWINTDGSTSSFGVMMGGGFETRNLGNFVLWEAGERRIVRIEVFNMDRKHQFSGYPVYWLGAADPQESVAYMGSLARSNISNAMKERVIRALALHDEPDVVQILQGIAGAESSIRTRSAALSWLGHLEAPLRFFEEIAMNADEPMDIRKRAIAAMGNRKTSESHRLLLNLYPAVSSVELKKRVLSAISGKGFDEGAIRFLMSVARDEEAQPELRRQAVGRLGNSADRTVIRDLVGLFDGIEDRDLQSRFINLFANSEAPSARTKLYEIASSAQNPQIRLRAIRGFSKRSNDDTIGQIMDLYDRERSEEVRNDVIKILGESYSPVTTRKLIAIAQSTNSEKLRKRATYWLGKSTDPLAVEYFESIFR